MAKKKKKELTAAKHKVKAAVDLAPLARRVELRDLRLHNSACAVAPGAVRVPELKQTIKIETWPKTDRPNVVAANIAFVLVGENPGGQEALRIEATFGIVYGVNSVDEFTSEQIAAVISPIGLANAWPYWREFVQSMTARMGLPPLRVPLFRPDQGLPAPTVHAGMPEPPKEEHIEKAK